MAAASPVAHVNREESYHDVERATYAADPDRPVLEPDRPGGNRLHRGAGAAAPERQAAGGELGDQRAGRVAPDQQCGAERDERRRQLAHRRPGPGGGTDGAELRLRGVDLLLARLGEVHPGPADATHAPWHAAAAEPAARVA